jgi:carboxyl-terminal processing protease
MRRRTTFLAGIFCAAFVILALALSSAARAQDRVALVIGNANYQQATKLANPVNDAADIAQALRALGFDVVEGRDLTKRALEDKVIEFNRKLDRATVALFFYAGHGLQVGGKNYLMPIDARLERAGDLSFETIDVSQVLAQMEAEKRVNLIFLDACRDNPLSRSLSRALGTRSSSVGRGLASISSAIGTMIVYATQPDNVALDGTGRNSPFTTALLRHIATPGLEVSVMMKRVRADVIAATREQQVPWDHSSLVGEVFLVKGSPGAVPSPPPPVAVIPPPPAAPRLTRNDVTRMFGTFDTAFDKVRADYVEVPDDRKLLARAIEEMRKTVPLTQAVASAAAGTSSRGIDFGRVDMSTFRDEALFLLNSRPSAAEDEKLVESAINGMLASLDPHSSYMNAKAFADMQVQTRGEFGGLGIEVSMEDGLIKVVTPIDDTPAARAGVRAGDFITHLDDTAVRGLTLNQAVERMRGPVGSRIKLTIKRDDQRLDVSIVRDKIRVVAVRGRLEGSDVGYIRITQFNEMTTDMFKKSVGALAKTGGRHIKGYVIDLRNNPGGLLSQAVAISDELLEKGEIVSTRGRKAADTQRFTAKPGEVTKGKPIIVLINGGTASGAEILAGALQDHKRATVLGSRSFGKGTVQTIIPLGSDKGAIRLTTSRYLTPSGRSIQANGITPDLEVLQDVPDALKDKAKTSGEASLQGHLPGAGGEQHGSQSYVPPDPRDDKALQRALEMLRTAKR